MSVTVPPIPYKVAMTDEKGMVSPTWAKYLRQLALRTGGDIALSNIELETLPATLATEVMAIQTDIVTIEAALAGAPQEINQGPTL